jgi:hypothetical protein
MKRTFSQIVRVVAVVSAHMLAALALVCALVVAQSERDETRHAEAILLICTADPREGCGAPLLDHALDRYRRGYGVSIVLTGVLAGPDDHALHQARNDLIERGVPEAVVLVAGGGNRRQTAIVHAATLLYRQGMTSVVLVDRSYAMLTSLKITRDLGIVAYGSPPPGPPPDIGQVVRGAVAYWAYVLGENRLAWEESL